MRIWKTTPPAVQALRERRRLRTREADSKRVHESPKKEKKARAAFRREFGRSFQDHRDSHAVLLSYF